MSKFKLPSKFNNKNNNNTLPKWFNATVYEDGGVVTNPFTGKSYELTAEELSMYDLIKGLEYWLSITDWKDQQRAKTFSKALDWFMDKNPSAYYTLLD